jgi:hypothetical protein
MSEDTMTGLFSPLMRFAQCDTRDLETLPAADRDALARSLLANAACRITFTPSPAVTGQEEPHV